MDRGSVKHLFFALRPKHWSKNLLIFLPFVFGMRLLDFALILKGGMAFLLFSLAASAVYLINDILDLEKDRLYPAKRLRPLASGKISVHQALGAASVLAALSIICSFMLDVSFGWLVSAYLLFNFFYTRLLKNMVIIDVFCLGAFFLLRIIAGCTIAGVVISHWIIFMTVFLALFLGFIKRRQELKMLKTEAAEHRPVLTRYSLYFIDQSIGVVTASIVVAYMLYTVSPETVERFGSDHLIYTIPFVYYGIFRYLYLVLKYNKGEDPTEVLFSDRKIQVDLALWILVSAAVIYFGL